MRYTYKSGESISYKGWNIKIEEITGFFKIYFAIDATSICFAYMDAVKNSGINESEFITIWEKTLSESTKLDSKIVDSITVIHFGFSMWKKCREDAQSHIDNVLGDGLSYVKSKKLLSFI